MQKLYEATVEIRNGEYTYNYYKLVYAEKYEDAVQDFKDYYSDFYGEGIEEEPDVWYFNCGDVAVTLQSVVETTVEEWKQKEFERVLLGKDI